MLHVVGKMAYKGDYGSIYNVIEYLEQGSSLEGDILFNPRAGGQGHLAHTLHSRTWRIRGNIQ